MVNIKNNHGLTLIELQISAMILILLLLGLNIILKNYLKQTLWIDQQNPLYAVVATDLSKVIFTETYKTGQSVVNYEVYVSSLYENGLGLTAKATLN